MYANNIIIAKIRLETNGNLAIYPVLLVQKTLAMPTLQILSGLVQS